MLLFTVHKARSHRRRACTQDCDFRLYVTVKQELHPMSKTHLCSKCLSSEARGFANAAWRTVNSNTSLKHHRTKVISPSLETLISRMIIPIASFCCGVILTRSAIGSVLCV